MSGTTQIGNKNLAHLTWSSSQENQKYVTPISVLKPRDYRFSKDENGHLNLPIAFLKIDSDIFATLYKSNVSISIKRFSLLEGKETTELVSNRLEPQLNSENLEVHLYYLLQATIRGEPKQLWKHFCFEIKKVDSLLSFTSEVFIPRRSTSIICREKPCHLDHFYVPQLKKKQIKEEQKKAELGMERIQKIQERSLNWLSYGRETCHSTITTETKEEVFGVDKGGHLILGDKPYTLHFENLSDIIDPELPFSFSIHQITFSDGKERNQKECFLENRTLDTDLGLNSLLDHVWIAYNKNLAKRHFFLRIEQGDVFLDSAPFSMRASRTVSTGSECTMKKIAALNAFRYRPYSPPSPLNKKNNFSKTIDLASRTQLRDGETTTEVLLNKTSILRETFPLSPTLRSKGITPNLVQTFLSMITQKERAQGKTTANPVETLLDMLKQKEGVQEAAEIIKSITEQGTSDSSALSSYQEANSLESSGNTVDSSSILDGEFANFLSGVFSSEYFS